MHKLNNMIRISILNAAIAYTAVLLLKLLYFNSQIGGGGIAGTFRIAAIGPLLVLTSISLLLKAKTARLYMKIINILLTFLIFSNIVYYRYFNDLLSIHMLFQASNIKDVQSSLLQLIHFSDLILAVDFVLLPVLEKKYGKDVHNVPNIHGRLWSSVICCAAGILIAYMGFNQLMKSQPTILQTFYDRVYVAQNIGLLNYHAADAYVFVQQSFDERKELSQDKKQEILEFFKAQKQQSSDSKLLYGAAKGYNVIVVQVEALQQFVINRSINGQEITPNLNKLASSGLYFDNYYYQTAGGGTSDAEFTSNVSMFPMKEGSVYIRKPGNYYYSLPLKLKENNYSTVALHGYKPGFWNRSVAYKNIGFDEFYSKNNLQENEILGMGISDKDFFRQAVEKLKEQQQPYYAFLITLSSHFPYDNDKSYYSSFDVGEYKDTLIGDYLEAIHYTDEALGQFVEELQKSGMLDNTVLAVYGDHHAIPKDNAKELAEFLGKEDISSMEWMQLQKVPLIINIPGVEAKTISTAGGEVDFMPTLLNILGIDSSNVPAFGRDLINSQKGFVVLRNGSFITNDKLYISSENSCYDIKTGEKLDSEQYKELKQEAERLLTYSDTIIRFDLADEIRAYLEMKK